MWSDKGLKKSPEAHYETMNLEEIKRLPVLDLAADNCVLWLWCRAPQLDLGFEVLRAWGFTFTTQGVWRKVTKNKKMRWGTGYVLRSTHEPFLIGKRGKPSTSRSIPSCFDGLAREHSRKPEEGYRLAEKMIPGARRADLFSREKRDGWTGWGSESEKFNQAA